MRSGGVVAAARGLRVVPGQLDAAALTPRARDLLRGCAEVRDDLAGAATGRARLLPGLRLLFLGSRHAACHASDRGASGRAAGSRNRNAPSRAVKGMHSLDLRAPPRHNARMPEGKDANGKVVALASRA